MAYLWNGIGEALKFFIWSGLLGLRKLVGSFLAECLGSWILIAGLIAGAEFLGLTELI